MRAALARLPTPPTRRKPFLSAQVIASWSRPWSCVITRHTPRGSASVSPRVPLYRGTATRAPAKRLEASPIPREASDHGDGEPERDQERRQRPGHGSGPDDQAAGSAGGERLDRDGQPSSAAHPGARAREGLNVRTSTDPPRVTRKASESEHLALDRAPTPPYRHTRRRPPRRASVRVFPALEPLQGDDRRQCPGEPPGRDPTRRPRGLPPATLPWESRRGRSLIER